MLRVLKLANYCISQMSQVARAEERAKAALLEHQEEQTQRLLRLAARRERCTATAEVSG